MKKGVTDRNIRICPRCKSEVTLKKIGDINVLHQKGDIVKITSEETKQLKELMGEIFDLYCKCDHTGWEPPIFKNKELGGEIQSKIAWLETMLWGVLMDLEDSFGLNVKEVEIDFKSLEVEKR